MNPDSNVEQAAVQAAEAISNLGSQIIKELTKPKFEKTQFPIVDRVIFNDKTTVVFFEDGTKSVVKVSANDTPNRETAIVYALIKRLYGKIDAKGNVIGDGVSTFLQKLVAGAWDQKAESAKAKKLKEEAKAKHEAEQKAAHEAAVRRRIERLKKELRNWQLAADELAKEGVNVSPQLVNEVATKGAAITIPVE